MHEAVTGVGQQLLSLLSPSLRSVLLSCLGKKALIGLRLPYVGELKVEVTALQKQELS